MRVSGVIEILGEKYREVSGDDAVLWRGDLVVLDRPVGDDCRIYMLALAFDPASFTLVNFVGYKAGAQLISADFPEEASAPGAKNVRLSWLKENWSSVVGLESFETSKFYAWSGTET